MIVQVHGLAPHQPQLGLECNLSTSDKDGRLKQTGVQSGEWQVRKKYLRVHIGTHHLSVNAEVQTSLNCEERASKESWACISVLQDRGGWPCRSRFLISNSQTVQRVGENQQWVRVVIKTLYCSANLRIVLFFYKSTSLLVFLLSFGFGIPSIIW